MMVDVELQALLLLSSLLESWDTLVVTLSNSAPEGKLTMDTVSDSLLGEEARRMDIIRAKIRINLEVDLNHAKKLHATTVEGWATGK